jgi:hypothetical protein
MMIVFEKVIFVTLIVALTIVTFSWAGTNDRRT